MPEHRISGRSIYLLMLVLAFVAIASDLNATGPDVEPYRLDAVHSVQSADFSPDGHFLALGVTQSGKLGADTTFSNSVAIWDLNSKKIVANTPFGSGKWQPLCEARFLHYMPDGRR